MMVRYRPFIVAFLLPVLIILAVPNSARAIYQLPFPLPPQDSIYWNQKTQLALRNGDLPNALIAFEHYIDSLTSRDLRDKMTFNWLLNLVRRDPRQTEKPTLADIRDLVSKRKAELNPEEDRDRIWRYNYLLAQIAVLEGRTDEAVTLMLQAAKVSCRTCTTSPPVGRHRTISTRPKTSSPNPSQPIRASTTLN